jgi:hypothetical protein
MNMRSSLRVDAISFSDGFGGCRDGFVGLGAGSEGAGLFMVQP